MFDLASLVVVSAAATLALTAWHADVPFMPIEISKLGNHGMAYWCFAVGGTVTALLLLLLHHQRKTLYPSTLCACVCLSLLTIVSDAGHWHWHVLFAAGFFLSSIWNAAAHSGLFHWAVVGAVVCYGLRALLLPLHLAGEAERRIGQLVQQVRALFQWGTVAFLLAHHITAK